MKTTAAAFILSLAVVAGTGSARPGLHIADAKIVEGTGTTRILDIVVVLSLPAPGPASVKYATRDGTAKAAEKDYQPLGGVLTFEKGEASKRISVTIVEDAACEIDETFEIVLSAPTGLSFDDTVATATILNDDVCPTPPASGSRSTGVPRPPPRVAFRPGSL